MSLPLARLPEPILVVGGYGYLNVGDEAMLAGLVARLGKRRLHVVSRDPAETERLHGVPAIALREAVRALGDHASVLIGGGGLFGRDMGRIGRLLPAYGLIAAARRRAVAIEGVDLDSRLSPTGRLLVPRLMRRACRVTVRDRRSAAILREWGVTANLAPDISAWMPPATHSEGRAVLVAAGADLRRPVVGLALSAVHPATGQAALRATLAAMDALPDVQFCFLPMSCHPFVPSHDDRNLARQLREQRPALLVLEGDMHPATMLAAIGQLSAVVAMRYHAMLFARRMGVPLIPIAYAEKNLRWLREQRLRSVLPAPTPLTAALSVALLRHEGTLHGRGPAPRMAGAT